MKLGALAGATSLVGSPHLYVISRVSSLSHVIFSFVSKLVDSAGRFHAEPLLMSFITPSFTRYLRKISPGICARETWAVWEGYPYGLT